MQSVTDYKGKNMKTILDYGDKYSPVEWAVYSPKVGKYLAMGFRTMEEAESWRDEYKANRPEDYAWVFCIKGKNHA
jgi:hypothetical protein